ncbi:NifB/NifX family molybdenum-iron cluster-binding protein [Halanaerobaculum tunisiense]
MKIAVTVSNNTGLEAEVDSKFGRTAYFAIIDLATEEVEFIANTAANSASGAGVKAAQLVADEEVETLISGRVGPKAFRGLDKVGIKIYTTTGTTLQEVIADYKDGNLTKIDGPTNQGHFGMN